MLILKIESISLEVVLSFLYMILKINKINYMVDRIY